ncbi:extracellular solute-binding protein [Butyrivibrio sp. CB08]|uniref:extracellular solute-binding protein n=1 Tax=Butyrivibrio sp. CB08 TaxID=2364879 RepID=UPI000EA95CC9|nr:extracellular solute-binding protein [Butyrivibrio sp. CB08]RKM59255.1 extracellular solute-binding protein [Butyrivibrio sp. CB08]
MRQILKKTVVVFLISVLLVTCFGCEGKNEASKGPQTTITIAARDGSHTDVINAVKGAFEAENNCVVNVVPLSADDIHKNALDDASNPEGIYDVIMIDDPLMPEYIEKKIIQNLTQLGYSDDEDFVEKSKLLGKDPYPLGATYALPFSGNVQLIFYNENLISDPSILSSWSGIYGKCEELKLSGKKGYAIRGQSGNPIVSDFLPILWAFGGDLFDEDGKVVLDSRQSREALEFYCKLYQTGGNYSKDELIEAITTGEAGIALGWPSWFISGSGSSAAIAQIPGKKTSSSQVLATGEIGNWLLGVTSNSKDPQLALKLAAYLTSEDVQRQALEYGGVPTRKSIFRDPEVLSKYPFFEQLYSGTNNSRVRPRTTKWARIEEVFGEELVKCIDGEISVDEAITNSHNAIQELANE